MAKNQRQKRILVLTAVVAGLAAIGVGAYVFRQAQLDSRATEAGRSGRLALGAGDHMAALDGIGRYLQRYGESDEAAAQDYILYARARRNVSMPNGKHMLDAMGMLRKALSIEPGNDEARADLLAIYLETGYTTEALDLIEGMLESSPRDLKLLRTKRDLMEVLRKFPQALEVARRINELAPSELEGFFHTLRIRVAAMSPPGEIDAWVDGVITSRPGDPRFELLRAARLIVKGGDESAAMAKVILDGLLEKQATLKDPAFVGLLIRQLDYAGRFRESLEVLTNVEASAGKELRRELVRRLWYARRGGEIPARVESWGPAAIDEDPELAALHGLALHVAGRKPEAEKVQRMLAAREDGPGMAWSSFYDSSIRTTAADPEIVARLTAAVAAVPESPLLYQALGDAHAALGEPDLAIQDWKAAAQRTPVWPLPLLSIARMLMATPGREALAYEPARDALKRAPNLLEAVRLCVEAIAHSRQELDPKQRADLLRAVDEMQDAAPERASDLLPLEAGLLMKLDKSKAEEHLRAALSSTTPASESTLLRLAGIASRAGIALATKFLELSETLHGVTPQLAFAKAVAASDQGDDGLRAFDEARARAVTGAAPLDWEIARTSFLDVIGVAEAGAAWFTLADANPGALPAQLGALGSSSVWTNREGVARVIERLKGLTGPKGTTWRIAHARWILTSPGSTEAETADAAAMLGNVVRDAPSSTAAHVLLAMAFERLRNLPAAEEELKAAAVLTPASGWVFVELARLAHLQGHTEDARRNLEKALATGSLSQDQVERAAYLLAVQGDLRGSASILEPLTASGEPPRQGLLLLSQIYANLGEFDKAIALCEQLLEKADLPVIELAAQLYAAAGRPADADAALARLDSITAEPGDRELVRARNAQGRGDRVRARDAYRKAIAAAPQRHDAWSGFAAFALSTGDAETMTSILDDPRAADVDAVIHLRGIRDVATASLSDPRLRAVVLASVTDKANRQILTEAARSTMSTGSDPQKLKETARMVRGLADANSSVFTLQLLAADLCAGAGDLPRAAELASRAMSQFPNSPQAAQLASEIYARSGRWPEALDAGLAWRDRVGRVDLQSEAFVASAQLRTDQAAEAVATLAPQMEAALAKPDDHQRLILMYAIALARSRRGAEATKLLSGLAATSPQWKMLPLAMGPEWLGDAKGATAWLTACGANIPEGDVRERLTLARAWGAAWSKFRDPRLLAGAKVAVQPLTASPADPGEAHFVLGSLAQESGDLDSARREYVKAIERDPSLSDAHNNLAVILADAGQWSEGLPHAAAAVAAAPKNANYLDTLAYVHRKAKQYAQAKSSLEAAIRLEQGNPAWHLSLGETIVESRDLADLPRVIAAIETLVGEGRILAENDRSRLGALRAAKR